MKFGTITRGDQKIYILLEIRCPEGCSVIAESRIKEGGLVPAIIAEKDTRRGEYVLILPLLHADQLVTVRVSDRAGNLLEEQTQKVRHFPTMLTAKYNTLRKVPSVNKIRNFDRQLRSDTSRIIPRSICWLGHEEKGTELVRITVVAPYDSSGVRHVPFSLKAFDRHGKAIHVENLIVLGDKVHQPVPHSSFTSRVLDISFRKSCKHDWIFISIEFEDDALPPALACINKKQTIDLRKAFEKSYIETGSGPTYEEWFFQTQWVSPAELEAQRDVRFDIAPLYSIIVPLFETSPIFFEEMIDSVLNQTYAKFELILVNASPKNERLVQQIDEYLRIDERVRVVTLDKNLGIALNTNEGIRNAKGDFLCFFDHDDVLEPNLLFEYTDAINRYPETDLLYCDEDKLIDGHYVDGLLKPDFSWELLMAFNYVCHLLAVRKSIVDEVELSDESVSGAQDWDMTMKVAEKARNVFHVRKVLYHWRIHKKSVASKSSAKPYTHKAGEIAIYNHFDRVGVPIRIHDAECDNIHKIEYLVSDSKPLVSIIIPNKDHIDMLERFLDSVHGRSTYENYEIVIVENNSTEDTTFRFYEELQAVSADVRVVFYEGEFNFSAVCNYGAKHARGDYFLFMNNDMEVITPNWIELLLGPVQQKEVGAVGAQLLFPNDTIQHTGVIILDSGPTHVLYGTPKDYVAYFGFNLKTRDVLAVTGACVIVSREDFYSINGFDESFVVEYNDVDFCLRLREKGRRIVIEPAAELYHYESVSRGFNETTEKKMRRADELSKFQNRWARHFVNGDPTYGGNISRNSITYELNWNVRA